MRIHTASAGESIYDIAGEYGVSPHSLNELMETGGVRELNAGREVIVPIPTRTYNVRTGDTLDRIAERFSVKKENVLALNPELCGEERLYRGQLLTLKVDTSAVGVAVTNGYCYPGCSRSRLMRCLPYADSVTVCAARACGREIRLEEWDHGLVELCRSKGKQPLLRIYIDRCPGKGELADFCRAAVLLAKSRGYLGLTLAGISGPEAAETVLETRKLTMENGIVLVTEGVIGRDCGYTEYSDHSVLTYDKIHLDDIPSFDSGERKAFTEHADKYEVAGAFVELPAFAVCGGKYIAREDAMHLMDKRGCSILNDSERKTLTVERRNGERVIMESLDNTKAKLGLIGELGFLGLSFDMMRVPICELVMLRAMLPQAVSAIAELIPYQSVDADYSAGGM